MIKSLLAQMLITIIGESQGDPQPTNPIINWQIMEVCFPHGEQNILWYQPVPNPFHIPM